MKQAIPITVQLIHIHGPLKGEIQEFGGDEIVIGRHAACNLQFPQDQVAISRKHAVITRDGNRFKIIDHSTNGTFVNGERITESYLKNGDVMFFTQGGPKVSFLTKMGKAAPAQEPELQSEPVQPAAPPPQATPVPQPQPAPAYQPPPQPEYQPQPVSQPVSQPAPQTASQPDPIPAPQPHQEPARQPPTPAPTTTSQERIESVKVPLVIQYGAVLESFNELPITIGTHTECDLRLDHPSLLEKHVMFFFSQGSYRIKDLSGRNQVLINNTPIPVSAALAPGDKVFLTSDGPALLFMEGGRLAEIAVAPPEEANSAATPEPEPAKPVKKKGSLFKKIFR